MGAITYSCSNLAQILLVKESPPGAIFYQRQKASDEELWSAPEQTIETLVIRYAIALIMTSL